VDDLRDYGLRAQRLALTIDSNVAATPRPLRDKLPG
jgi:hypothetical protein